MNDQQIGYILGWGGGLLGILLGFGGAFLGTYIPYRQAKSPRQKSLILKSAAFFLSFVVIFLAGLMMLPLPWNHLLWIPYIVILVTSIRWFNNRQRLLVEEESAAAKDQPTQGNP